MTTLSDDRPALAAEQLRARLTNRLCAENVVRTPGVEAALRSVRRDLFVPAVSLERAYADDVVSTKSDSDGQSISAASQPRIVAMMLEQLQVQPGQRVLEIGAGTGYNAALLAHLAGEDGHVTTIDVDADIVDSAREHLTAAGVRNVEVRLGDGALGVVDNAPYDRIIATVGAYGIPDSWLSQLKPAGRLVVPVRLRGSISRSIVFQRDTHGGWRSIDSQMCGFMPLRGEIADDPRRMIPLTRDGAVTLQVNREQTVDAAAMAGVLDRPRTEVWTGVMFAGTESLEWMYLWLTCALDNGLSRMPVLPPALDAGLVAPMFRWGAMAVPGEGDLAYLTRRPGGHAIGGGSLTEVGVIGHGAAGREHALGVAEQVRAWDAKYRWRSARFEISDVSDSADPSAGRFFLHRPHNPVTAIWE